MIPGDGAILICEYGISFFSSKRLLNEKMLVCLACKYVQLVEHTINPKNYQTFVIT